MATHSDHADGTRVLRSADYISCEELPIAPASQYTAGADSRAELTSALIVGDCAFMTPLLVRSEPGERSKRRLKEQWRLGAYTLAVYVKRVASRARSGFRLGRADSFVLTSCRARYVNAKEHVRDTNKQYNGLKPVRN